MYCDVRGMSAPAGPCSAGYYCISGAQEPTPLDFTNERCMEGHYCLEGTISPTPCPPGTINPSVGADSLSNCLPCPPGKFCEDSGATEYTGICDEGYYCPEDAEVDNSRPLEYICSPGYFCPNDTATPQPCPPGNYVNISITNYIYIIGL